MTRTSGRAKQEKMSDLDEVLMEKCLMVFKLYDTFHIFQRRLKFKLNKRYF